MSQSRLVFVGYTSMCLHRTNCSYEQSAKPHVQTIPNFLIHFTCSHGLGVLWW